MKITVLTGSNRPGRFNIQPARWIADLAKSNEDIEVNLVDLQELQLPFLDESVPPSMNNYSHAHTKAWSKVVNESDGFIFVTPEYNHSYSAVLKNALDFLFHEWNYKPVAFVSYGALVAGSRAVEHLRTVVSELKMYDLREQVLIPNYWEHLNEKGQYEFNDRNKSAAEAMLKALIFWAQEMKQSRKRMDKVK